METLKRLEKNGQIATQYVDERGKPLAPPNGSLWAIEGISSQDGKVFGRMAHSERIVTQLYTNTPPSVPDTGLFWGGAVQYFS